MVVLLGAVADVGLCWEIFVYVLGLKNLKRIALPPGSEGSQVRFVCPRWVRPLLLMGVGLCDVVLCVSGCCVVL